MNTHPYCRGRQVTRIAFTVVALLLFLLKLAEAQTSCNGDNCSYDFSVTSPNSWPQFTEVQHPSSGSNISVQPGSQGIITVNGSALAYYANLEHLTWDDVIGFNSLVSYMAFSGDNGVRGWVRWLTDGSSSCRTNHAPMAADELYVVTVFDTGSTWVGLYVGNPTVFGKVPGDSGGSPAHYAATGVIQKDKDGFHILSATLTDAIPMNSDAGFLQLTAKQDDSGVWTATGVVARVGNFYFPSAELVSAPDTSGTPGIITATDHGCAPNGVSRQFLTTFLFAFNE